MVLTPGRDLSRPPESARFRVRQHQRSRLDLWLQAQLGWSSRTKIQKLISLGRVRLNGDPARASTRVGRGDEVEVRLGTATTTESTPPKLPVLMEDPWLLAIEKPTGMLVHPVGKTHVGTVVDGLHRQWRELNDRSIRKVTHRLCHRLDRDTSGLLLLAKTVQARRILQNDFEANRVQKSYLAIVEGVPDSSTFEVNVGVSAHIDRSRQRDHRLARADEATGKPSRTCFQLLASKNGISVLLCRPITGRQNQIRVHLQVVGHPIVGDHGYGQTEQSLVDRGAQLPAGIPHPGRALLHSFQLRFPHPIWKLPTEVRCLPAADMGPILDALAVDPGALPTLKALQSTDGTACQGGQGATR
ncbi:MAG: RluA family pseudouridine synthase [Planctomycetota bacterium]|nr:RluA family pseudouridine synthase [Planctomycetota bacterium]